MEDDFQMLKCLFWQLLQKTETSLARTTRKDVKHCCKREQAHGKQGQQNPESIDAGKIAELRAKVGDPINCVEWKHVTLGWDAHTILSLLCTTLTPSFTLTIFPVTIDVNMLGKFFLANMCVTYYGVSKTWMSGVKQICLQFLCSVFTTRVAWIELLNL